MQKLYVSCLLLALFPCSLDAFLDGLPHLRVRRMGALQKDALQGSALRARHQDAKFVRRRLGLWNVGKTRCQAEGGRQGTARPEKGPDPLAPSCTDTQAIFKGEMYNSADGTKVLELADGSRILERRDGVQVGRHTVCVCLTYMSSYSTIFSHAMARGCTGNQGNMHGLLLYRRRVVKGAWHRVQQQHSCNSYQSDCWRCRTAAHAMVHQESRHHRRPLNSSRSGAFEPVHNRLARRVPVLSLLAFLVQ
jgi:hypothetical protein